TLAIPAGLAGVDGGQVNGVNNAGFAVGKVHSPGFASADDIPAGRGWMANRACWWGSLLNGDLNREISEPRWTPTEPLRRNDARQILAVGDFNGTFSACVLTPVRARPHPLRGPAAPPSKGLVGTVSVGVAAGGAGSVWVNGHRYGVGPHEPVLRD